MDSTNEFNDLEPSFADLPMETIVEIFRYLNFCDVQSASLTCHRWLEASQYSELQANVIVRLTKLCISDKLTPARLFLNSERPFPSVYMEETTFGTLENFFSYIGKAAAVITFDSVDLCDKQFCAILQDLSHLSTLTLRRCSSLFMDGQFLESPIDRKTIAATMSKVCRLSLKYNQYLSDAILMRLTSLISKLVALDMSSCHIAYHSAIQRRFYPEELANNPSESILTFKYILHVIRMHQTTLQELNFSDTLIGGAAVSALCEVKDLKLFSLFLSSCRQLDATSVSAFMQIQDSLLHLDLSDTPCITDACVETIVETAKSLETLHLKRCSKITNSGALALTRLLKLKSLDISHCDGITCEGITGGIARTPKTVLQKLYMSHLNLCEECVQSCAEHLSELRVLDIGNCINGVTDQSVQAIIENLKWLRELSLEDCFRITDAALTGINLETHTASSLEYFPQSPLSSDPNLNPDFSGMKISLRSKAEQDIVHDAEHKKDMLAICELYQCSDITGVSIQRLKGLRTLNLKGCNQISDVALKYSFRFIELRRLLLSNCQQVSFTGIEAVVRSCPSLEELDLSDCYNINDKTIEVVTSQLKRLKTLHLSGCTQLTDHSIDSIIVNCKVLQTLSVHRCRRMCSDIEERLANLTSIRTLNMDHTTTMDNADLFRLKKFLDY